MNDFVSTGVNVLSIYQDDHLEMVEGGNYAYLAEETSLKTRTSTSCELDLIKETLASVGYGIGLQKNSAYSDLFSHT